VALKNRGALTSGSHTAGMLRWLLTYADLITLLLIFFVLMYSVTSARLQQVEKVAMVINQQATGGQSMMQYQQQGTPQQLQAMQAKQIQEETSLEQIVKLLQQYIKEHNLTAEVSVNLNQEGVVVSFEDVALFSSGSADLSTQSRQIIDAMATPILNVSNEVRVEGFTDDVPISTPQYPSNWELSTARATSVLQELLHGVKFPAQRLSASGYGQYRPRVPNNSDQNRQLNRRVDLVVLRSIYNGGEPAASP